VSVWGAVGDRPTPTYDPTLCTLPHKPARARDREPLLNLDEITPVLVRTFERSSERLAVCLGVRACDVYVCVCVCVCRLSVVMYMYGLSVCDG